MTHRAQRQSPYESLTVRPQLIEDARRHRRRRRKIVGTVLIAPLAVGGLIVGVVFVDGGGQGKVVAHSATSPSKGSASPAPPGKFPSALSPSNVVVLNPATSLSALPAVEKKSIGGQFTTEFQGRGVRPYAKGDVVTIGFSTGGTGYGVRLIAELASSFA